jgi:two-component system, probable response regulator PhcQ
MLPFNNASMSMYRYLKDALAETAWRNPAQKQWSQLRLQDHWRVPIDETQRAVALSETLLNKGVLVNDGTVADVDLVAAVGKIAEDINQDYGSPQVNVVAPSEPVIVAGNAPFMQGILQRLVEPVSRWAAPGSTLQVSIKNDKSENGDDVAQIVLESRNCEPSRSMNDCVLFAPALTITPPRASEFLRATMAVGHIGGDIHSPPMENGFKQVHLTLPSGRNASGVMFKPVPRTWLQDLNDAYEKWVMGTLDLAH